MTNYERLKALTPEEMAWFLMAYSDNCRCCVYKRVNAEGVFDGNTWDKCSRDEVEDTCVGGYRKWLESESSRDEEWMFAVCRSNVLIDKWNAMSPVYRDGYRIKYENGLAVDILDDVDEDIEWIKKPLPF